MAWWLCFATGLLGCFALLVLPIAADGAGSTQDKTCAESGTSTDMPAAELNTPHAMESASEPVREDTAADVAGTAADDGLLFH